MPTNQQNVVSATDLLIQCHATAFMCHINHRWMIQFGWNAGIKEAAPSPLGDRR